MAWRADSRSWGNTATTRSGASWTSSTDIIWDIFRNSWSLYIQDSWTIGGKLTINAGLRTETEYIPAFTSDLSAQGATQKPIEFSFGDKLAPRLGAVYDVYGDSSLKIFGSFGIYYDVMKLYMAEGAFGGFKWKTDYYELNNPDWTKVAATGKIDDRASQEPAATVRRHHGLAHSLLEQHRPRYAARPSERDLAGRREEARRERVPVRSPRPEAPHPDY